MTAHKSMGVHLLYRDLLGETVSFHVKPRQIDGLWI